MVRALYEIDLVNRPYIYSNTPMDPLEGQLQVLRLVNRGVRSYTVQVPAGQVTALADAARVDTIPADGIFVVDHKRLQYPFMPAQSLEHNGAYCHGMIEKIGNIMPVWQSAGVPL